MMIRQCIAFAVILSFASTTALARNTRYQRLNAECNPMALTSEAFPDPSSPPVINEDEVIINPDTLRQRLLKNNRAIMIEANAVHQAKTQVAIARGRLLPSINVGSLLLTAANPSFALATVEFLLPFLLPTNWFSYFKSKHLVQAEKIAFRLVKLNTYASAYALYYDVMSDRELKQIFDEGVRNLRDIESYVERQYNAGIAPLEDFERATAQRALAEIDKSKIQDLVIQETATMRHLLAADTASQFKLNYVPMAPSPIENLDLSQAAESALGVSLELDQMVWLRKSAKLERWQKVFGFASSSSLSANQNIMGKFSFSTLRGGMGLNFGFDYFPSITLANYNIKELQLREEELRYEVTETLEVSLAQLQEAHLRTQYAAEAEQKANNVYLAKKTQYELGVETLFSVLETRSLLQQAKVEALRARTQLNLLRVTLHRTMLTDQFAKVEGCKVE